MSVPPRNQLGRTGPFTKERLLLVEGPDDKGVYEAALAHCGKSKAVEVFVANSPGGSSALMSHEFYKLIWERAASDLPPRHLAALGVIVDSGTSPQRMFTRTRQALLRFFAELNLDAKHLLPSAGQVLRGGGQVAIGILTVPTQAQGGLETICLESLNQFPATKSAKAHVLQCRRQDPPHHAYSTEQEDKSRLYSVLAVGIHQGLHHGRPVKPPLRLDVATNHKLWDFDHAAFADVIRFLNDLALV